MRTTRARKLFDEVTAPSLAERWKRVQQLIADAEEESLWLDFKELDPTISTPDSYVKDKLARALSGFANTEGGVLLYGISTKVGQKGIPDRAQKIVEINNVAGFRLALEKLASNLVDPVIDRVVVQEIPNPACSDSGVVAVYVPQSDGGPHRVVKVSAEINERYYMRTTTEFVSMPHALLADRFGRRASPRLELQMRYIRINPTQIEFRLVNWGRGAARRPAVQLIEAPPSVKFEIGVPNRHGFIVIVDHSADRKPRWLVEPSGDAIIYPGMDRVIAYASETGAPGNCGYEHQFRAILHALDSEPIEGQGALAIGLSEHHEAALKRIAVLPPRGE